MWICLNLFLNLANLAMIPDQLDSFAFRYRWTRRRMTLAILTMLGFAWVTAALVWRDPARAMAIELFDSLTPGINEAQAIQMLESRTQITKRVRSGLSCTIDNRFTLYCLFDKEGQLTNKFLSESTKATCYFPSWLTSPLQNLGLPVGPLFRKWP